MSDEYDDDAAYTEADLVTAAKLARLEAERAGMRTLLAFAAAEGLPASSVWKALSGTNAAPSDPPVDDGDDADDDDTDLWTPARKAFDLHHDATDAERLDAAALVALQALEDGSDPEEALARLHEHGTFEKGHWDPALHPKGKDGRFIKKDDIQAAKSDPKKAAELKKQVKDPEERKKLDKLLADPTPIGTKRGLAKHEAETNRAQKVADRAKVREIRLRLIDQDSRGEELNPDDLRALIPHLGQMSHEELSHTRELLARQGASFGGKRLRADRVAALVAWATGKAQPQPAQAESGSGAGEHRSLSELHGLAPQPQGVTVSHATSSLTYLTPDEQAAAEKKYRQAFGGMSDGQIAALVGAPDGAQVRISWNKFDKRFEAVATAPGFSSHRYVTVGRDGKPKVENFRVVIGKDSPLKGQGIKLFARQVDALAATGQTEIETNAKGSQKDKTYFGYKVWPKVGYDGPLPGKFLRKMPKELAESLGSSPKLSALLKTEAGRKWWDENGSDIDLTFDLREGSESRKTLANYLASKGQPKSDAHTAAAQPAPTGTSAAPPKTRLQALAEKSHAAGTPSDDPNTEYATPRDQYLAFTRAVVPPSGTKPDSATVLDYLSKLPDHARERLDQHFRASGKSLREVEQFHRQAAGQVTPAQVRADRAARADAGDAARAAMTGSGAAQDANDKRVERNVSKWADRSNLHPETRAMLDRPAAELTEDEARKQLAALSSSRSQRSPGAEFVQPGSPTSKRIADRVNELRERLRQQPWQRTQRAVQGATGLPPHKHKQAVSEALAAGKSVPPEVLADYPDLAAKYAQTGSGAVPTPTGTSAAPDLAALKRNPKADLEHIAALQKQHAEGSPEWEALETARFNAQNVHTRDNSALAALHGKGKDAEAHGRRHFALERLASAAAQAHESGDAAGHKAATDAVTSLGGTLHGPKPGETTTFDGSHYDGPAGAFTGDAVRVTRQPVTYNGALVYRGKVEPVASGSGAAPAAGGGGSEPPGEIGDYLDPTKYPTRQGYVAAEAARLKRILPDDPEELLVAQAEQWANDRWTPPKEKGKYSVGDTVKHGDTVGSFRGIHTGPDGKKYGVIAHNRGQSAVPFGEIEHEGANEQAKQGQETQVSGNVSGAGRADGGTGGAVATPQPAQKVPVPEAPQGVGKPAGRFVSVRKNGRTWEVHSVHNDLGALKDRLGLKHFDTQTGEWVKPGARGPVKDKSARVQYGEVPQSIDHLVDPTAFKTVGQMRQQFARSGDSFTEYDQQGHYNAVKNALALGKPVPPEVLADYPDLAAKYSGTSA